MMYTYASHDEAKAEVRKWAEFYRCPRCGCMAHFVHVCKLPGKCVQRVTWSCPVCEVGAVFDVPYERKYGD